MTPRCLYQSSWSHNLLLDMSIILCNCFQEPPTQKDCYLHPNNVRPAFYHVKSVTQFCPQSTVLHTINRGSQHWEVHARTSRSPNLKWPFPRTAWYSCRNL